MAPAVHWQALWIARPALHIGFAPCSAWKAAGPTPGLAACDRPPSAAAPVLYPQATARRGQLGLQHGGGLCGRGATPPQNQRRPLDGVQVRTLRAPPSALRCRPAAQLPRSQTRMPWQTAHLPAGSSWSLWPSPQRGLRSARSSTFTATCTAPKCCCSVRGGPERCVPPPACRCVPRSTTGRAVLRVTMPPMCSEPGVLPSLHPPAYRLGIPGQAPGGPPGCALHWFGCAVQPERAQACARGWRGGVAGRPALGPRCAGMAGCGRPLHALFSCSAHSATSRCRLCVQVWHAQSWCACCPVWWAMAPYAPGSPSCLRCGSSAGVACSHPSCLVPCLFGRLFGCAPRPRGPTRLTSLCQLPSRALTTCTRAAAHLVPPVRCGRAGTVQRHRLLRLLPTGGPLCQQGTHSTAQRSAAKRKRFAGVLTCCCWRAAVCILVHW